MGEKKRTTSNTNPLGKYLVKGGNVYVYAHKVYTNAGEYTMHKAELEFTHEAVTSGEDTLTPQHQRLPKLLFLFLKFLM